MSDLLRQFVDGSEGIGAGLTSEMTSAGAVFRRDGAPFAEAPIGIDPKYQVDPSKYFSFVCFTGHTGERQASGLRTREGDQTRLGYILPISSLRSGEFLEGDWMQRYAWAASYHLLSGVGDSLATRSPSISLLEEAPTITDLFSDHLAVCVVGKQNLASAGVELNQLPLMLMREGVRIPTAPAQFVGRESLRPWLENVNVSQPSADVAGDIDELTMMLAAADSFESPIGEFLTFYQAIEYAIQKIFGAAVPAAVKGNLTPWVLKDRLSRVATEKWRLSVMASKCIPAAQGDKFGAVAQACKSLLAAAGEVDPEQNQWWEYLYSVRNILVHGQIRIVRDGYQNLRIVNSSLREACLEILINFSIPELETIWETREPAGVD